MHPDLEAMLEWLPKAIDNCLPLSTKKINNHRPPAPWFTDELKAEKTNCKVLESRWKRDYAPDLKLAYKKS